MAAYILSIDQGTTSCRAIVFSPDGDVIGIGQSEFTQYFPHSGWVEHDANEILEKQIDCVKEAIVEAGIDASQIACVGLTNQRETTVVWNKETGEPIGRAIVWQCRRTAEMVEKLVSQSTANGQNVGSFIRQQTGLIADAYFSGPKIRWLLDNVPGARKLAEENKLAFGTIDSWLIYRLTEEARHLSEPSNASRTMLFDINSLVWDEELLKISGVPKFMLPEIIDSDSLFGHTRKDLLGFRAPLLAVLGDQQAALYGQACTTPGMFKCTYGTGSFLLGNIGTVQTLVDGLLTTIAWKFKDEAPVYAIEGASFMGGATIQWLRDKLNIIESSAQSEEMARSLLSNEGVYLVPAHVGLGSPWWNPHVRGTILGMSRDTGKVHLVRAALESIAYQIKDIAYEIKKAGLEMLELRVDGGAAGNNWLMQFQADLLEMPVKRRDQLESTAWGVAALAGRAAGIMHDAGAQDLARASKMSNRGGGMVFLPDKDRQAEYKLWRKAVNTAMSFNNV